MRLKWAELNLIVIELILDQRHHISGVRAEPGEGGAGVSGAVQALRPEGVL